MTSRTSDLSHLYSWQSCNDDYAHVKIAAAQNVNYPGLRALYDKYNSQGFNLIAFPCNQVPNSPATYYCS